jgi:hypothetical protein
MAAMVNYYQCATKLSSQCVTGLRKGGHIEVFAFAAGDRAVQCVECNSDRINVAKFRSNLFNEFRVILHEIDRNRQQNERHTLFELVGIVLFEGRYPFFETFAAFQRQIKDYPLFDLTTSIFPATSDMRKQIKEPI